MSINYFGAYGAATPMYVDTEYQVNPSDSMSIDVNSIAQKYVNKASLSKLQAPIFTQSFEEAGAIQETDRVIVDEKVIAAKEMSGLTQLGQMNRYLLGI